MTEAPLVSIALCTYNGERYLIEQLDSLVNQTYANIEIIAVDDCSTDSTFDILLTYAARYSFFKCFKNDYNLGYPKNFEKAISLCSGKYIALADQDDIWDLDKINIMQANIGDSALIYHDSAFVDSDGKTMGISMSDVLNMYEGSNAFPLLFMNCVTGHATLFNAHLRQYLGTFSAEFHHDWWIALIATQHGGIKYFNKPLVQYRQHGTSYTDILKLKDGKEQAGKHAQIALRWLMYIGANVKELAPLANKIVSLHNANSFAASVRLMLLICFNYKKVYYTRKKSNISKLNAARKFLNNKSDLLPR
jgi:glycosyltransferase involved in cell wall biosynthesis